ncbi:alpha-L-arabinofuranosidase C-terminal domain-containing protein [Novipirellula artificiosorum]|uniref:non-reducing end alpha-L-arabinofuranosidase n=1 Tax=Novipirellula artificiosorum TaxID=2528016 RepID=A0A5C6DLW9_9BACT|nr:alpha-L-arabinofuranosidase C-terminal domain-containing protein [Novipirellula artificiosorum]TWU35859.1 Extracellular exo-alpha-L-arabinofuranosidase precursor [Novipirellula artificiosorum]
MRRLTPPLLLLVYPFLLAGVGLVDADDPVAASEANVGQITVHVDQPTVELSESLYGLFYEDINYAADGGLYAELVQNRSFEYYPVQGRNNRRDSFRPLYAWDKVETGGGQCDLSVEHSESLNTHNTNYVQIRIQKPGDGVGIANRGFDGIYVVEGDRYDFSFYAKRTRDFDSPVTISLESESAPIAKAILPKLTDQWARYEVSLSPSATVNDARLLLTLGGTGDVCMDMISLFPRKTYNGRKNGLRADLVQALVDLKPAVFRFPGGCIAHGQGLDNAYRWKDTVGDVAMRKPNWNLWGYHQTYGLGYYEYFQLCEDIGAEPLPILPVGVSCGFRKPFQNAEMGKLQEWVDDATDLVEFANGPVDSTWGKIRAEMGHPEPFHLKYIGLGNEDHHTAEFEERFPHFVRALREQAPEIKIVGTSGLGHEIPIYEFMNRQGCELSDEHYYESPEWFIDNADRFDDFDRSKTKIFVGEYASRGNRLYNAVAEAVYLTGIERNADIVQMTAYAPLFARYGFTQWQAADLIWFDEKSVVRTPNYYVQQLFSVNKGDHYLKNESEFTLAPSEDNPPAIGQVGVGTWATESIYDDIQVSDGNKSLLSDDFSNGSANWVVEEGDFSIVDGGYLQSDSAAVPATSLSQTRFHSPNLVYSLRAKKIRGNEGFLILFGNKESGSHYWWNIAGWNNTRHGIERAVQGKRDGKMMVASCPGRVESGVWYDVRVEISPGRIQCFLNGERIHDVKETQPTLHVAASHEDATGDVIVKVVNPTNQSCSTGIHLEGVDAVNPIATLTLLTGKKDEENDRETPDRVAPEESQIKVAKDFDYTIPPMSVQFIRIRQN